MVTGRPAQMMGRRSPAPVAARRQQFSALRTAASVPRRSPPRCFLDTLRARSVGVPVSVELERSPRIFEPYRTNGGRRGLYIWQHAQMAAPFFLPPKEVQMGLLSIAFSGNEFNRFVMFWDPCFSSSAFVSFRRRLVQDSPVPNSKRISCGRVT